MVIKWKTTNETLSEIAVLSLQTAFTSSVVLLVIGYQLSIVTLVQFSL